MSWARRIQKFNRLMNRRIRSVLLVSTAYDAFIMQEEGNLTEQIFLEYKALSLSSAPHFTHVASEPEALKALQSERFDLVLRVVRLAGDDLGEFAARVKQLRPGLPVVVLGFDHAEMSRLRSRLGRELVDSVFLWNGDAKILLAIIKEAEDRLNVDNDLAVADLRVILVVEDSIRYHSAFLSVLYPELMKQSQSLFAEGTSRLDKLLRMRTRPKVLHAANWEEALDIYRKYCNNLLALVSDVGFPRGGRLDPEAGLELARLVRRDIPDLPIVLQSAESKYAEQAKSYGLFVDKNSPDLLHQLRDFLIEHLGFGPFIFRLEDGTEIARAKDIREFRDCLRTIPEESLRFHASHNHISNWLLARSEFDLAAKLRPQQVSDFPSLQAVREYLIDELGRLRRTELAGTVSEFSERYFDSESLFQKLGSGMLGGKARGLAFLNYLLNGLDSDSRLAGIPVRIPRSFVISTDAFTRFLEQNNLQDLPGSDEDDATIVARCLRARLPADTVAALRVILENVREPLAVRSSSLLEDDMLHPFAGVYETRMLPNTGPLRLRLARLCQAVKLVYASTFCRDARAYQQATAHRPEEEQMAVVIQSLVGQRFGKRFYPHVSGVAHSHNFYPLPPLRSEDGVVMLALGLGRMVVEGGEFLLFSPAYPAVLPQFPTPADFLKYSQRSFFALDLEPIEFTSEEELPEFVKRYPLEAAAEDGVLQLLSSVYDASNEVITESPSAQGPLVLTFNNILKYRAVPLAEALQELLALTSRAMGMAVELEFACDLSGLAARQAGRAAAESAQLFPLQLRPVLERGNLPTVLRQEFEPERALCRSRRALGHGRFENVRDIVYVKPNAFQPAHNTAIAREVERLNGEMVAAGRNYLLIGPGRWGSADHWLGIPVKWPQISSAQVIVEVALPGYHVEPSQGTHFFHNLTALRRGYLTIPAASAAGDELVDWSWLDSQPAHCQTDHLRHLELRQPLVIEIDGSQGVGVVVRPPE